MRKWFGFAVAAAVLVGLVGCGGGGSDPVRTAAGSSWGSSDAGLTDGPVATARFSNPVNTVVSPDGIVYVADFDNNAVRAIDQTGNVSTLTKQDKFQRPFGLTMTRDGKLYVSTDDNDLGTHSSTAGTVWQIDRSTGVATMVANNLGRPRGILALPDGRIVLSDLVHDTISILDPATKVVTPLAGKTDTAGFANGTGTDARFDRPYGVALMSDGSILVADQTNSAIRKVTMAGVVTTFVGTGTAGHKDGAIGEATLNTPQSVVIGAGGKIYVGDNGNHVIRRIAFGQVTTVAGNGTAGFVDAPGLGAEFFGMEGMSFAPGGHDLWIADGNNGDGLDFNHVRKISVN